MRGKEERESIQCHLVKNGSKIQLNPDHKAGHKPQPGSAKCGAQLLQPSTALATTFTFRFYWKKKMKSGVGLDGDGMRSRRLLCRVWGTLKIQRDETPAPPTAWSQPLVLKFQNWITRPSECRAAMSVICRRPTCGRTRGWAVTVASFAPNSLFQLKTFQTRQENES